MKTNQAILADQLADYQEKLKSTKSYVKELKTMTAKHSTPNQQFESDLNEAMHNIGYYEGVIDGLKKQMVTGATGGRPGSGTGTLLPKTKNQGIGALIFSSIGFAAGTLLGSRLKSGKSTK